MANPLANQRWILFLPLVATIAILAGCNSGSTANVQNPPPPPPPNVTIAWQSAPAASLAVGFTESLTAVVSNDSKNLGVDWHLTCQADPLNLSGLCGTLTVNGSPATHTASGSPITYTAPSTLSSNNMAVEIVAYASANPPANQVATTIIGSFDSSLPAGNYVLQAQGVDTSALLPYQLAGVMSTDGQGDITAGELTVNASGVSTTGATVVPTNPAGTGSSYFIGNDGRGTINLNWTAGTAPNTTTGTETLAIVFLNNSTSPAALVSEVDANFTATGTLDLQTSIAAPSGSYAFAMNGSAIYYADRAALPIAFGGVISGVGSGSNFTGVADEVFSTSLNASVLAVSGSYSSVANDQFGTGTFTLTGLVGRNQVTKTALLTAYPIDATHIALIESDQTPPGPGFGSTGGLAISQGSAAGTFTNQSLSGTYAFGMLGVDLSSHSNAIGSTPATLTAAGLFNAATNCHSSPCAGTGYTDTFLLDKIVQISSAFDVSYSVSANGRVQLDNFVLANEPKHNYNPTFFLYLTGPPCTATPCTNPAALVLSFENSSYPSVGTGLAYQQTGSPAFSGDYGVSFTQQNGAEVDGAAQMNANTANTPAVSGLADANSIVAPGGNGFLGTFTTSASSGPFPGTLYPDPNSANQFVFTNPNTNTGAPPGISVNYYFIDRDHGFWIETDLATQPNPTSQVSFGYYAARTPLCTNGCP